MNKPMNFINACKLLCINGDITKPIIKTAYRRACQEYHPDRNPGGLEMMKSINIAYKTLLETDETSVKLDESVLNFGDDMMAVINGLSNVPGLELELIGTWLWIFGKTQENAKILKYFKCRWAPKQEGKPWYYRPADHKSFSRGKYSMDEKRAAHGSSSVKGQPHKRVA